MSFEKTLTTMMQWVTATEALAALGAELALQQPDVNPPPEIAAALEAVSTAAGMTDLDQLPPPQRAMLLGIVRMYLRQAGNQWPRSRTVRRGTSSQVISIR